MSWNLETIEIGGGFRDDINDYLEVIKLKNDYIEIKSIKKKVIYEVTKNGNKITRLWLKEYIPREIFQSEGYQLLLKLYG